MSFEARQFGHAYYGWRIDQLPKGEWRDRVQALHSASDPEELRRLARQILGKGPLLAWCMVFTLVRYYGTLQRWGIANPFLPLVGLLRKRALQVLGRPSGAEGLDYTSALMVLAFVPRYRDLPLITSVMSACPDDVDVYDEGLYLLEQIAAKGWGRPAPELLAFVASQLEREEMLLRHRQRLFRLLILQGSDEAEQMVWDMARHGTVSKGGMAALTVLLEHHPKDALELASKRRKELSKDLDELDLDDSTKEHHKKQFAQARKAAQQQQLLPEEAAALLSRLSSLLAADVVDEEILQTLVEQDLGVRDRRSVVEILAAHMGQHGRELDGLMLRLCDALHLATSSSWQILREPIAAQLDAHPIEAAKLLLQMTNEQEVSPDVQRIATMFEQALDDNAALVEALAFALFLQLGKPIPFVVKMFDSPRPEVRREALDLLSFIPDPPMEFDDAMQEIYEREKDPELQTGLRDFLDRLQQWRD